MNKNSCSMIALALAGALAGCQGGTSVGEKQEGFSILPPPWLSAQINIQNKHDALGFCGDPVGDLSASAEGGYVQRYQDCDITDRVGPGGGTFEVHGAIRDAWHSLSSESGWLGYPLSDETDGLFGGRMSVFEHGFITWNASNGVHIFPNMAPPSRSWNSGQINLGNGVPGNGNCQLGIAANGDWEFHGHAHDSGFPDYQYSIGASISWTDANGVAHSKYMHGDGVVQGSIHLFGNNADDDVDLKGNDPELAANWGAIMQNGSFRGSLHMSLDGVDLFAAVVEDIVYPAAIAGALVLGYNASNNKLDNHFGCGWGSGYEYSCE